MTVALTAALLAVPTLTSPAVCGEGDPVDPSKESANLSEQGERAPDYTTPKGLADQATHGGESFSGGLAEQAGDPGRLLITDLGWSKSLACGGDHRLHRWQERGYGIGRCTSPPATAPRWPVTSGRPRLGPRNARWS